MERQKRGCDNTDNEDGATSGTGGTGTTLYSAAYYRETGGVEGTACVEKLRRTELCVCNERTVLRTKGKETDFNIFENMISWEWLYRGRQGLGISTSSIPHHLTVQPSIWRLYT